MAQVSIDQALELAFGHHEAGRLAEAEILYCQLFIHFPDRGSAWHWMGCRACETGHLHVAIELRRTGHRLLGSPGASGHEHRQQEHTTPNTHQARAGEPVRAVSRPCRVHLHPRKKHFFIVSSVTCGRWRLIAT